MGKFEKSKLLGDLGARNLAVAAEVEELVEGLTNEQLNWHDAPSSWSIAQILSHLVASHGEYLGIVDSVLATVKSDDRRIFKSSWTGNMMVKVLSPRPGPGGNSFKLKAPKAMQPPAGVIDSGVILRQYLDQQRTMLLQLDAAATLDIQSRKIPLSISKLLKLPAGDVWRFITVHNESHLLQMQKVKIHLQEQMEKQRFV